MHQNLLRIQRFPGLLLALSLAATVAFLLVLRANVRMETDLDEYMPRDHPAFVFSAQAEEWFGIKDGIVIAIERPEGIYDPQALEKVKRLTQALQKLPEVQKGDVSSLATADNIVGTEDGMDVEPFFRRPPTTAEEAAALREKVRANEMIRGRLVSEDETVTLILAEIEDDVFSQEFYERILALAREFEGPERIHVAGTPIVEGTMAQLGPRDMKRMVPIVLLVITLVLLLVLRSVTATVFTMLVVAFSTVWTFGLMAAVGIPVYAVSTMIPVMLVAIGVADGIHIYSHLQLHLEAHPNASAREAVAEMLESMWKPVVMTSVTTAIGFVSLLTSEVYPIKYFGLFTAFGVLSAMVLSLVLIPAGILVFGLPRRRRRPPSSQVEAVPASGRIAGALVRHRGLTIGLTAAVVAVSLLGVGRVWINSSFLDKFERDSDLVLTDAFINAHFGGTSSTNVILDADRPDAFKEPAVLEALDRMQRDVDDSLDIVGNAFSLVDYLRRMNKVMHADDPAFDRVPESRALVAQYLLLYEMSGDPERLWAVVDKDFQRANVTFQLKKDDSRSLNAALAAIERHVPALAALGVKTRYAGSGYKALVFTDLILEGQIASILVSLLLVLALLSLMFRSVSVGLVGSIPIVLTAAIGFGVMGWLDIPLSTTTALLSSIAIGIGIDYSIHFIARYRIELESTPDRVVAGARTMHHSGRAIVFNAVVVIAGFLVLVASVFPPNRALGALVSLNMFTSFVGTVTVMFVVLTLTRSHIRSRPAEPGADRRVA